LSNCTPKSRLSVSGKMSEDGADRVGNKLANAALILAIGAVCIGLIVAIRW